MSLIIGIACKNKALLPRGFDLTLNKILINFFVPVLTLLYLPELQFKKEHLWLIISPWLIYLGSLIFFEVFNLFKAIPKKIRAVLIMTSGIGSISFAGFPIFQAFYGAEGLAYGIVLSLAGTFVVCNTLGVLTGFWYKNKQTNYKKLLRNIFLFPPFLAMSLSLFLVLFGYQHHSITKNILTFLGAPFSVLALFTIGLNIKTSNIKSNKAYFLLGQSYKLLIAPILVYTILYFFSEHETVIGKICVLGAGLGSMNTIAIVAANLGLKPKLAYLMPGLGIPISILTVLIIHFIIR